MSQHREIQKIVAATEKIEAAIGRLEKNYGFKMKWMKDTNREIRKAAQTAIKAGTG